jgi:uncharacterized membrane protein YedE/YeeE
MDWLFPLFTTGQISNNINLFLGLFIGFGFGFILEKAGFGTSKHIATVFYFRNLRVTQTMIAAIVTAATWVVIFSYFGWMDFSQVFIPITYVWPYLVGGAIFGAGMVMSGWCPGTSVVGVATGKIDAVVFVVGMLVGMFVYFQTYAYFQGFANSGNLGRFTINKLVGGDMYTSSYLITVILAVGLGVFMNIMKSIVDKKGAIGE